jgi:hypothetical protein
LIDNVNLRFGLFSSDASERRFWSIEVVESMVAFKINSEASNLISNPTVNEGADDSAEDFRYEDNNSIRKLGALKRTFTFLNYVPLVKTVAKLLKNYLINRKFSANKYFK